jgi:RNA polymerase sigma factor (sigma-70 family)
MSNNTTARVIEHLRDSVGLSGEAGPTDGELLRRFIDHRDATAFASLVNRHASMVWGVCRRLLGHVQDAEDAFQATFLVLVRKAASVVPRSAVGAWLHGVAYNTALKAQVASVARKQKEKQVEVMPEPEVVQHDAAEEAQQLLDQELNSLPAKYRQALVLCDLEGRSRKEAARQLKIPEGTLSSRLTTARTMLAKRLTRRGVVLPAVALMGLLSRSATSASVPTAVVSRTIEVATLVAAGQTTAAGLISNRVTSLSEGVIRAMLLSKLKFATVTLLLITLAALGAGYLFGLSAVAQPPAEKKATEPIEKKDARPAAPEAEAKGKTDPAGAPLEVKLIARKAVYVLDLDGKTPEEFRKHIKETFQPVPQVDLELEFRNSGDKEIKFLVGGFNPDIPMFLKLDGPGALNLTLLAIVSDVPSSPPTLVTLAPGKTHTIPIKSLATDNHAREATVSYWTQPGEYTLTATYKTAVSPVPQGAKDDGKGFGAVTVVSAPVKLKVAKKDKSDPPGVPLEAKLVARKAEYVLNLGGKTQEEFRKLLETSRDIPSPEVELDLEFHNTGDKEIKFLVGGTNPDMPLLLKLDGPGAANISIPQVSKAMKSDPPQQVSLAPGKSYAIPLTSLRTLNLGRDGSASYWSEPGEYTLTATYKTAVSPVPEGTRDNGSGFGSVDLFSAPVKLKVVPVRKRGG